MYSEKNKEKGPQGWANYNQDASYRAYEKRLVTLPNARNTNYEQVKTSAVCVL